MTLKEKIQVVLDKYNNGRNNGYSQLMTVMIESESESIKISGNTIKDGISELSIEGLIGRCIIYNNPDLFKHKDHYLQITEHCPH